jgi:DHA1 family multidrug resistance protein-like MFS transporter
VTAGAAVAHWRRNQAAVTLATFVGYTGFTLVMPFLPLYFEQLGVHDTSGLAIWSGMSLGVTPAVTAAVAPAWARVADRLGRKVMVARSLASFVVIMALLGYVRAPWQVFALRAVQGLFAGYGPIAMTMAAESSPREHMAAAIGWVQTAQRLGPALGPVIGGTLAQTIGLRAAFTVASGFYLIAFALVLVGYREPRRQPRERPHEVLPPVTFQSLRLVPHFVLFMGTIFGLQLVDRSFGPVLPLYLHEIGMSVTRVPFLSGCIFTVAAGAAAVGNQVTGWLVARLEPARLVPAAAAVAAVAATAFGLAPPIWVLVITSAVLGFGIGVATTAIYTAAGHAAGSARGVAFGYLTTAYLIGLAASPVLAGFIGSVSMRAVFLADALGLAIVAAVVGKRMARHAPVAR